MDDGRGELIGGEGVRRDEHLAAPEGIDQRGASAAVMGDLEAGQLIGRDGWAKPGEALRRDLQLGGHGVGMRGVHRDVCARFGGSEGGVEACATG